MGNPKELLLGKGVCERRGLFWQPARRALAKAGGLRSWKRGSLPPAPDIYFFPTPITGGVCTLPSLFANLKLYLSA